MSLSLATAGLIGAGITGLSHLIGGKVAAKSNERAAEKQMGMQQDLINRQNVYNSPANQMRRLQEAGLNPNLVYGGGNVTGNQSGTGSAPSVASNGDYGLSKAADSINTYMAINNHDMDMQMKRQQLLHNNDNHGAEVKQAAAQLEKTQTEDKVLNAQLTEAKIRKDILEHDRDVITGKKFGMTSGDRGVPGLVSAGGRFTTDVWNDFWQGTKKVGKATFNYVKDKFFR